MLVELGTALDLPVRGRRHRKHSAPVGVVGMVCQRRDHLIVLLGFDPQGVNGVRQFFKPGDHFGA